MARGIRLQPDIRWAFSLYGLVGSGFSRIFRSWDPALAGFLLYGHSPSARRASRVPAMRMNRRKSRRRCVMNLKGWQREFRRELERLLTIRLARMRRTGGIPPGERLPVREPKPTRPPERTSSVALEEPMPDDSGVDAIRRLPEGDRSP